MELDWEEMQELIAGLLRGMGYKTMVSSKGHDRGRDIVAFCLTFANKCTNF